MITNAVVAILMLASWERRGDAGQVAKYGERFDPNRLTCATCAYPSNAVLRVTEIHNGSSVIVRVIDTPAQRLTNRIDLSPAAFKKLNGLKLGVCEVAVSRLPTTATR